jgi:hypothetical protein
LTGTITTLYVSPAGKDSWSGRLAAPDAAGQDGPFATVERARAAAQALKREGRLMGQLRVELRVGTYPLRAPLCFGPDDSGPITYAAYPGEQPVLDGGRRIEGWRRETANGVACWVADLPDVAAGKWVFRQLFVNGERRERARLPKREGSATRCFWMADVPGTPFTAGLFDGTDAFVCHPGDVRAWPSLAGEDAEAVVLHYWSEERLPIAGFDPQGNTVRLGRRSVFSLKDDFVHRYARYYVENVFEALSDPGEWYLDRAAGRLYYVPLPGDEPETTEVVAPAAERLLALEGDPDAGRFVEFLRFEGLTFRHTDWLPPIDTDRRTGVRGEPLPWAVGPQAARNVPGAVALLGARYCAVEGCTVERVGGYAVDVGAGCRGVRVVGNTLRDLGAGGVKLWGTDAKGPRARRTGECRVTDNHIHAAGRVFPSACGVLAMHAYGNTIGHNHIHDLYYTGVSCGWVWGYRESVSRDNRIEHNHIHDLGHGLLSDMGGIYTLGVQPGTVLRGNVIHDVEKHTYGGWGIYLDEGSSHILVEGNLVYRVSSQAFNQHYGRENVVRHNVFAFGREGQVSLSRREEHLSFTLLRNVLLGEGQPAYANRPRAHFAPGGASPGFTAEANVIWDTTWPEAGPPDGTAIAANGRTDTGDGHWFLEATYGLEEWRALGQDLRSVVADPGFRDAAGPDFSPAAGANTTAASPLHALGIVVGTAAQSGIRPATERA